MLATNEEQLQRISNIDPAFFISSSSCPYVCLFGFIVALFLVCLPSTGQQLPPHRDPCTALCQRAGGGGGKSRNPSDSGFSRPCPPLHNYSSSGALLWGGLLRFCDTCLPAVVQKVAVVARDLSFNAVDPCRNAKSGQEKMSGQKMGELTAQSKRKIPQHVPRVLLLNR